VYCMSSKQKIKTKSSCEAELVGVDGLDDALCSTPTHVPLGCTVLEGTGSRGDRQCLISESIILLQKNGTTHHLDIGTISSSWIGSTATTAATTNYRPARPWQQESAKKGSIGSIFEIVDISPPISSSSSSLSLPTNPFINIIKEFYL
jgi:hypothetical protein